MYSSMKIGWLTSGVRKALRETLLVQMLLAALWLSMQAIFKVQIYGFLSVYVLGGPLWCAFRWRLTHHPNKFWRWTFAEMAMSTVLFLEAIVSLELLAALPLFGIKEVPQYQDYIAVAALLAAVAFFCVRVALRLWVFWDRLRKRYLRWALTHAHLLIVVICTGTISVLLVLAGLISSFGSIRNIVTIIFGLFIMLMLTIIALAIVLPPSAIFSYFFSRQLTRRIEKLATATGALRAGNYHVRVAVEGEDEIARLQADFNVMADELEHTLHELQEERDNVAKLLQARRELIASVSHELRTPVATVRSYLESTLTGWQQQPPPTLRQDLHVMQEQTIRLQSLIDDLFMLARAEVGQLELRYAPTNVELLVRRVVDTLAPVAWRGSRVEVLAEIAKQGAELPRVLVDERRLEQILQNLLHNGIRHTPPGGIVVVSAAPEANMVVLQVKDTGEGIPEGELSRIWDRFYRTQSARQQPGSGTGLGLAIVKELTETMGGSVTVESVPGQGTCFTIRLPRLAMQPSPSSEQPLPRRPDVQAGTLAKNDLRRS